MTHHERFRRMAWLALGLALATGCNEPADGTGKGELGGTTGTGGAVTVGGEHAVGGDATTGGASANGGVGVAEGGNAAGGESTTNGGASSGGTSPESGRSSNGGNTAGGGVSVAGASDGGRQGTAGGAAGSAGIAAVAGAAGSSSPPVCNIPDYSSDCSKVPMFQCGPAVTCDGTTFTMQWHEHVMCTTPGFTYPIDNIVYYRCTYPCALDACKSVQSWPSSGSAVAQACDGS